MAAVPRLPARRLHATAAPRSASAAATTRSCATWPGGRWCSGSWARRERRRGCASTRGAAASAPPRWTARRPPALLDGDAVDGRAFAGTPLRHPWHRRLGTLAPCDVAGRRRGAVRGDVLRRRQRRAGAAIAGALRSAIRKSPRSPGPASRSSSTRCSSVAASTSGTSSTGAWTRSSSRGAAGGALRVDFGEPIQLDRIVLRTRRRTEPDLAPALHAFAEGGVRPRCRPTCRSWRGRRPLVGQGHHRDRGPSARRARPLRPRRGRAAAHRGDRG